MSWTDTLVKTVPSLSFGCGRQVKKCMQLKRLSDPKMHKYSTGGIFGPIDPCHYEQWRIQDFPWRVPIDTEGVNLHVDKFSEHVSSQIWCQKFFLLLGGWGWGPSAKIFFPSLNMYQAKSGVKNFSLYWGWGGEGGSLCQNFFSQSEHVSSQIWCQKFFPLLGGGAGGPSVKIFFPSLNMYQAKSGVKNFSLYWDPPPPWA